MIQLRKSAILKKASLGKLIGLIELMDQFSVKAKEQVETSLKGNLLKLSNLAGKKQQKSGVKRADETTNGGGLGEGGLGEAKAMVTQGTSQVSSGLFGDLIGKLEGEEYASTLALKDQSKEYFKALSTYSELKAATLNMNPALFDDEGELLKARELASLERMDLKFSRKTLKNAPKKSNQEIPPQIKNYTKNKVSVKRGTQAGARGEFNQNSNIQDQNLGEGEDSQNFQNKTLKKALQDEYRKSEDEEFGERYAFLRLKYFSNRGAELKEKQKLQASQLSNMYDYLEATLPNRGEQRTTN